VIMLRHARSTANGDGVLAWRLPGVGLDDHGRGQATDLIGRLAQVPLAAVVHSPLQRCAETVLPLTRERNLEPIVEEQLSEVDYGEWSGRKLSDLVEEPLWRVVQHNPSAAVFPGGEGLADVHARAVAAVRRLDAAITREHGEHAVWLLCSHGDVIKALLADALGQHLDSFQRIVIDPASISVVRYSPLRTFVLRVNDCGGSLESIVPRPDEKKPGQGSGSPADGSDAVVGGTTGA